MSLAKRRLNFQWEWLPQFPTKGLTEMFMANRRSPYYMADTVVCLYYMADTGVCPYYMADTRVCPYHSPLTTRYSPFAIR